jgi:hypothetical protein
MPGSMQTLSLGERVVTAEPVLWTVPEASWPIVRGLSVDTFRPTPPWCQKWTWLCC